jgi:four helix bundle protein
MEAIEFEFQKWPVYVRSIEFCERSSKLCFSLQKMGTRSIADQLRRASHSIALNIAEGSSRYSRNDKTNFMRISRGSVFECVAILDVLKAMGCLDKDEARSLQKLLSELGKMLSGFIKHVEANNPNLTGGLARKSGGAKG